MDKFDLDVQSSKQKSIKKSDMKDLLNHLYKIGKSSGSAGGWDDSDKSSGAEDKDDALSKE